MHCRVLACVGAVNLRLLLIVAQHDIYLVVLSGNQTRGLSTLFCYPDRCGLNPVRDASARYPVPLAESHVINVA